MSPWGWLLIAGAAEVAWSQSIRPTDGLTRPLPTLLCVVLAFAAIWPLSRAVRGLPVGLAYAVFTGIGAVGAVVLGVVVSHDPLRLPAVLGTALIVGGVLTLRATT